MIEAKQLQKCFPVKETFLQTLISAMKRERKFVRAVNGVSFTIERGEMMGLAGESGCGKTTTGLLLVHLYNPTGGEILFGGKNVDSLKGKEHAIFRRKAQMVFQDPYESLNPRFSVQRTIEEPLIANKIGSKGERREKVIHVMEMVNLIPVEAFLYKFPHELSGGERQRVCIARSIVLEPVLLVADEAVSMLDVSIRASILNLLRELTEKLKMATLYISHDISLLGSICDKMAIMYAGEFVETGKPEDIINFPQHPYAKALIGAVPVPEFYRRKPKLAAIKGEPPDLISPIRGCSFRPRCGISKGICLEKRPELYEVDKGHFVACNIINM